MKFLFLGQKGPTDSLYWQKCKLMEIVNQKLKQFKLIFTWDKWIVFSTLIMNFHEVPDNVFFIKKCAHEIRISNWSCY